MHFFALPFVSGVSARTCDTHPPAAPTWVLPAVSASGPRGPPPHSPHPKIIFRYDGTRGGRKRELASTSKEPEREKKNRARCELVVWPRWVLALNEVACEQKTCEYACAPLLMQGPPGGVGGSWLSLMNRLKVRYIKRCNLSHLHCSWIAKI